MTTAPPRHRGLCSSVVLSRPLLSFLFSFSSRLLILSSRFSEAKLVERTARKIFPSRIIRFPILRRDLPIDIWYESTLLFCSSLFISVTFLSSVEKRAHGWSGDVRRIRNIVIAWRWWEGEQKGEEVEEATMYARLLLLRSSKLGCIPRRLASSSSGPRVPKQAVRAIFLIFTFHFFAASRRHRSIGAGTDQKNDWPTCMPSIQFLTRSAVRVFNRTLPLEESFCVVRRCN